MVARMVSCVTARVTMRSVLQTQRDSPVMVAMVPASIGPGKLSTCWYILIDASTSFSHGRRIPEVRTGIPINRRNPRMSASRDDGIPETTHLVEQTFEETLAATPGLVMVDFWAAWCGPCQAIAPVLDELAEAMEGRVVLLKVNVDESPALAARYGIRSIPTLLFFKEGTLVDRVVGAVPRTVLQGIVSARAS